MRRAIEATMLSDRINNIFVVSFSRGEIEILLLFTICLLSRFDTLHLRLVLEVMCSFVEWQS
jgi:hypothetical protein